MKRQKKIRTLDAPTWLFFHTKIAGVTFANDDQTPRQKILPHCREGELLRLVREPDNPHGEQAVKVVRFNGEQLGYLPSHVAAHGTADDLDAGRIIRCRISSLTGGGEKYFGCNIEIAVWSGDNQPTVEPWAGNASIPAASNGALYALIAIIIVTAFAIFLLKIL